MQQEELNRRAFHRLTMAALGGMMTGAVVGCGGGDSPAPATPETRTESGSAAAGETAAAGPTEAELDRVAIHACRGLNECKSDKNDCAGQSACATVSHSCHKENACRYLGGCEDTAGANACKGQGACAVPILDKKTWQKARDAFEARMKSAGKSFGPAPEPGGAKPESSESEQS